MKRLVQWWHRKVLGHVQRDTEKYHIQQLTLCSCGDVWLL